MKARTPLSKVQRQRLVSLMKEMPVSDPEAAADEVRRLLSIPPRPEDRQIREPS